MTLTSKQIALYRLISLNHGTDALNLIGQNSPMAKWFIRQHNCSPDSPRAIWFARDALDDYCTEQAEKARE